MILNKWNSKRNLAAKLRSGVIAGAILASLPLAASAQTFVPTAGVHAWNDDANWGGPFPNGSGATAILSPPTGNLEVTLGQPITISSLSIQKAIADNFTTLVTGGGNSLTFDGAGVISNEFSSVGVGPSIIAAPITLTGGLTITQRDNDLIQFSNPISGVGGVTINRDTNGGGQVIFGADNTYDGATIVAGNAGQNFQLLQLNSPNALPSASNLTLTNSAILGLGVGSTDFTRSIGTGPGQVQFVTATNSGFAAFGGTRNVNIGGAGETLTWGTAGFGTLTLGYATADGTVNLQNPINFGSGTITRTIRSVDGPAAIDGRLSGSLSSTGTGNLTKTGGGSIALAAANTYTGATIVEGSGALILEHPNALPATSSLDIRTNGVLGLGAGDYSANIGTAAGEVRFSTGNAGFAAYGADRTVTLNGGAPLVFGTPNFITTAMNFVLSDTSANATLIVANGINLSGANGNVAARDGLAAIDGRITGVISGVGAGSTFTKRQEGVLELTAANTYEGVTTIQDGVLVLSNANAIPGGTLGGSIANLALAVNGATVGLGSTDFTAGIGTGPGQISFGLTRNQGFAAYGADRIVNLGGASQQLVWGGGAGFDIGNLLMSAVGATHTLDFQNPIDLNGAQRTVNGRSGSAIVDAKISGVISGFGGSLNKVGNGTLALTAANTYDGGTIVTDGRLAASSTTGSSVGSGDVTVLNGATLGGTGFIGTESDASNILIEAGGRLGPGADIGTLTVYGDVTFATGGIFNSELSGNTVGLYDQLVVNGVTNATGEFRVNLYNGYQPTVGDEYTVLTSTGGILGEFETLTLPTLTAYKGWDVEYTANSLLLSVISFPSITGDYNADGFVDAADYTVWRDLNGQSGEGLAADGDGNGVVNAADYDLWKGNYGAVWAGAGSEGQAVPEPGAVLLLVSAVPVALWRRRR